MEENTNKRKAIRASRKFGSSKSINCQIPTWDSKLNSKTDINNPMFVPSSSFSDPGHQEKMTNNKAWLPVNSLSTKQDLPNSDIPMDLQKPYALLPLLGFNTYLPYCALYAASPGTMVPFLQPCWTDLPALEMLATSSRDLDLQLGCPICARRCSHCTAGTHTTCSDAAYEPNEKDRGTVPSVATPLVEKPPFYFWQLIYHAISSSPDGKLTLPQICSAIEKAYPYYNSQDSGWKGTVKYTLTTNPNFDRVPQKKSRCGLWAINPVYASKLTSKAYKRIHHRGIEPRGKKSKTEGCQQSSPQVLERKEGLLHNSTTQDLEVKDGNHIQSPKPDPVKQSLNPTGGSNSDLRKDTEYQVRIAAATVNGTGPFTAWETATTNQDDLDESTVPPEPAHLIARPKANSIKVSWAPPPPHSKILVRGYVLGYGRGISDVYKHTLDANTHDYVIENLQPASHYVITIRAYNSKGQGPSKYETVITSEDTKDLDKVIKKMTNLTSLQLFQINCSNCTSNLGDIKVASSNSDNRKFNLTPKGFSHGSFQKLMSSQVDELPLYKTCMTSKCPAELQRTMQSLPDSMEAHEF